MQTRRVQVNTARGMDRAIETLTFGEGGDFDRFAYSTAGREVEMDKGSSIVG